MDFSDFYISKIVFTLGVLIVDVVLSFILKKVVDVLFSGVKQRINSERGVARTATLKSMFKNIIDFILLLISIMVILSFWGINIMPILTGAGILGLAISFGAQTFIKDVIAGMFIILEDQYHIGDKVKISTFEGVVENITLRLTVLKDKKGDLIYIPNSQITTLVRVKA